jgi:DNA-binding IclR family transcriptional regulator
VVQRSSVTRALRILDLLARAEKPVPLRQIAQELEIPKSTAHGILKDLVRERFVDAHDPAAYTVGIKAFEVGAAHLRIAGVDTVITSELTALSRALEVTAHYAVLDGREAVYLYKQDPPRTGIQLASSVGARLPAHLTAVGKCALAWLSPSLLESHVDTAAWQAHGRELREELDAIRERGYATDHGQVAVGIECVAAPVFDSGGARGAVGVSYLRGAPMPAGPVSDQVRATANRLTTMLGGSST